jgi:cytochrome c7-like protein
MTGKARRFRLTIASMMAFVAAFALLWALVLPLIRQSQPPCLSVSGTARWLLTKPGTASCKDCHANFTVANRPRSLSPLPALPKACTMGSVQNTNSCTACHVTRVSSVSEAAAKSLQNIVE